MVVLQVATLGLLTLNSLEQALEVASTEALKLVALNNLNEDSRTVHEGLGEELEEVATLVVVDEDVELLDGVEVLLELPVALLRLEAEADGVVVGGGDVDELDTTGAQGRDGGDDVLGQEGDVLDSRAGVEGDILLDLGLFLSGSGLVDGHLDEVVGGGHDDGGEGRELGGDLVVVDGPEAVEVEALFVKGTGLGHLVPALVADAVVDADQGHSGSNDVGGGGLAGAEAGEEVASEVLAVDESVRGVAVGVDDGGGDRAVLLVGDGLGGLHGDGVAIGNGAVVDGLDVVYLKGNVLDGVAVAFLVGVHLLEEGLVLGGDSLIFGKVLGGADGGGEDEADVVVGDDIGREVAAAGFQTAVRLDLEVEQLGVVCSGLLGVAYPPRYVVVTCEVGGGLDGEGVVWGAVGDAILRTLYGRYSRGSHVVWVYVSKGIWKGYTWGG